MNLTERLLNPETVEEALEWLQKNAGIPANTIVMPYPEALKTCTSAIRELHARLAAARAEGAAEAQRYKAAHELWTRAEADLAAARAGGTR